jgi:hypothetical protein
MVDRVRIKGGIGVLAAVALMVAAPSAAASTASLGGGDAVVVYEGDAGADEVGLFRGSRPS